MNAGGPPRPAHEERRPATGAVRIAPLRFLAILAALSGAGFLVGRAFGQGTAGFALGLGVGFVAATLFGARRRPD